MIVLFFKCMNYWINIVNKTMVLNCLCVFSVTCTSGELTHCTGIESFRRKLDKWFTNFEHFDELQTQHPCLVQCPLSHTSGLSSMRTKYHNI